MCVCVCVTGALLKAVCVCSGVVSLSSGQSLGDQLMERWGGGLEIHSWSTLPTGSGLGELLARGGQEVAFNPAESGLTWDLCVREVEQLLLLQVPAASWRGRCWLLFLGVPVEPTTQTLSSTLSSTWNRFSPQVKPR